MGDSADKHAQQGILERQASKLRKDHVAHGEQHVAVQDRAGNIEILMGDSAEEHAEWGQKQARKAAIEKEYEA